MRYLGLVFIPLFTVLIFAGPGCQQAQDEPKMQMEQAVEKPAKAPMMEKAPAAMEEAEVPTMEEVEIPAMGKIEEAVKGVEAEAEKEGSGLLKQLKEKGEEEAQKKADDYEVEKKIDDLGM